MTILWHREKQINWALWSSPSEGVRLKTLSVFTYFCTKKVKIVYKYVLLLSSKFTLIVFIFIFSLPIL